MTISSPENDARLRAAYLRHYDRLLSYALRRTANREDAEEIVATTFATAWRRVEVLPPEPLTLTWLYRVAWKTLANHHRATSRRANLFGRLAGMRSADELPTFDDDGLLHEALSRLRPKEQEALRLIAWDELSYTEAAAVLACSPNAFAIRLHRARAALRRELDRLGGERGSEPERPSAMDATDD